MNYVEVAVPFFILAMAVEAVYGWLTNRQTYRLNDTVGSLQLGTLSRLNDVLKLGFSAVVFGALVEWSGLPQWSMSSPWRWIAAFVAYDFCYYWKHRYGHEWRILWASHVAHHQSEEFNLSTALRQTGTDYIGFVFYVPLYLAGVPAAVVVTVGSLNLIYQFWVHTEHIRRLGLLEWIFVTPANHRVHHARNPLYIDKNYGGVFILWDRLFGTYQDELATERCVYGIASNFKSFNPHWANFHFWYDTARISWRTRRWRDKFLVWFKPPGWYPEDVERPTSVDWRSPKFDPVTSTFTRVYSFVQLWICTFASLWLLKVEKELPRSLVLALFVWICVSFYVQSMALEGRAFATKLEWSRIAVTAAMAIAIRFFLPDLEQLAIAFGAYAVVSAIAVGMGQSRNATPDPSVIRTPSAT